ncbi:DUF6325 family protein [Janibacter alittae]|uniref:DUF6325 family protein n=1 Tax=Janibacter alittae TaxID=3115209 RepID=A0ABZ2MEE6_9MICO
MTQETALGPLDFFLIEFPEHAATSHVATELSAVLDRGLIRLLDVAAVRKDDSGRATRADLSEVNPGLNGFEAFAGAQSGLFDTSDLDQAGEALAPGMSGLLIAIENTWAGGLVTAVDAAGGRVAASEPSCSWTPWTQWSPQADRPIDPPPPIHQEDTMPGLLRGVARTAVIAGTASAVNGRVQRRQAAHFAAPGRTGLPAGGRAA